VDAQGSFFYSFNTVPYCQFNTSCNTDGYVTVAVEEQQGNLLALGAVSASYWRQPVPALPTTPVLTLSSMHP
jgi:hypothetical protein